jgi:hypothetical protein
LRTERAVHKDLQVADAQQVVTDPREQAELLEPVDVLVR